MAQPWTILAVISLRAEVWFPNSENVLGRIAQASCRCYLGLQDLQYYILHEQKLSTHSYLKGSLLHLSHISLFLMHCRTGILSSISVCVFDCESETLRLAWSEGWRSLGAQSAFIE